MNASKKLIFGLITLCVFTTPVSASSKLKEIKAYVDPDVSVSLNGQLVVSKPILHNNSIYVPLRDVALAFDARILSLHKNKKDIYVERVLEPVVDDNPIPNHNLQSTYASGFGRPILSHNIQYIVESVKRDIIEGKIVAVMSISVLNKSNKDFNFKPNLYIELEDTAQEFDFNNQRFEIVGPDTVPPNKLTKYQIMYHELPKSAITYVSIIEDRLHDIVWVPLKPIVIK
ncbi:hypothetical protein [Paenibacillus gansuensis]|uniref:Copper amine oxidase-like N-terminal domain-containing protein n=1 Tax=Paenibacillus gansuensis TaxID=306542 RepID=A0ABW5PJ84_9BACL